MNVSNCIEWKGYCSASGYGVKTIKGNRELLHRFTWEWINGPIPSGLCVLHKCDNPPCVNPEHLFLGTIADNNRDKTKKGRHHNTKKTHCIRNHPLSGKNLYVSTSGKRVCKTCRQAHQKKFRGKK